MVTKVSRGSILRVAVLAVLLTIGLTLVIASPVGHEGQRPIATRPPGDYILMPRAELMALPTSGPAWEYLLEIANGPWPSPDLNDPDSQVDTMALAAGLAFARTGDVALRDKAREAILAVIPTFQQSNLQQGLGPLRQTAGWVLAADLIALRGDDDTAFRGFLRRVLTEPTGTHPRWNHVVGTHDDSANNWGAWAGAARIAADLYLGADLTAAVNTTHGFLGDRAAWSQFNGQKDRASTAAADWACNPDPAAYTPVNGPCTRDGIDLDGAVPADISREEAPLGVPGETGIMYSLETLAGYSLQAELLYRNGYPDIYDVQSQALRRMGDFITRSGDIGGPSWNPGRVQLHIPWLLNRRYGTSYPTEPAQYGRSFGFTDWLYGAPAAASPSPASSAARSPDASAAPGASVAGS